MNETTNPEQGSIEEATASLLADPNTPNQTADSEQSVDDAPIDASENTSIENTEDNIETEEQLEVQENIENTPTTYAVKVDGVEEQWTLDQLRQSASGQKYIQKEMQKTAQIKKQAEQTYAELQKEREQLATALEKYQNQLNQVEIKKPDIAMADSDPIQYSIDHAKWIDAVEQKRSLEMQKQKIKKEQQAQNEKALKTYLDQEAESLKKAIPEFANQETAIPMRGKLVDAGASYGFSEEEIANIIDSRAIRVLNDARKYQELTKKGNIDSKVTNARPLNIKPGAKKVDTSQKSKAIKDATAKLQETGSVDDAANWLLATS